MGFQAEKIPAILNTPTPIWLGNIFLNFGFVKSYSFLRLLIMFLCEKKVYDCRFLTSVALSKY